MPKYFSVSDVMTFLQCREKWDLSSPNRKSLRHKASPRIYLTTGSAFHEAIDAHAKDGGGEEVFPGAYATAHAFLQAEREKQVEVYKAANGFSPWDSEMKKFDDAADLTLALVEQYFEHYGYENPLEDQGLRYIATEVPFKVDISQQVGIEDAWFVGTFDGIAADEADRLWLVENKTFTAKPDVQDLQTHFQTTGYAVAWNLLTGTALTGALYNGISKKLIKEPRVLQSGALSTDVSQQTTLSRYLRAITSVGDSPDDPKYAKILKKLRDIQTQGDTRFFYREKLFYNEHQIANWWEDFHRIVHEMENPKIYRTVPYNGCGPQGADCWWRDICFAKHTGKDHESLIEQRYEVGSYGTVEAVAGIESVMVSSVEELREALRNV